MAVQSGDLLIVERAGVLHKTTAGEVGALGGGGGGGATGGVGVLNFGALPGGGVASLVVTGQAGIGSGARVRAWIPATASSDYNVDEHALILAGRVGVSAGSVVAGVGFTIYAETELLLTGNVSIAWEWSN